MRISPFFFLIVVVLSFGSFSQADLITGKTYPLNLVDVDGRTLSTADGHVTTVVLATRANFDKARLIGDRTPDRCLGNPKFRMVTVIQFEKTTNRTMRFLFTAIVRRRVDAEANRLKARYLAKKSTADPRRDVHVVADFDGRTASQLGLQNDAKQFRVLIFSSNGGLLRDWTDVPSAEELDTALR